MSTDRGPDGRYQGTEDANALLRRVLRDRTRYEVIPAGATTQDANALLRSIVRGVTETATATTTDRLDANALLRQIVSGSDETENQ